MSDRFIFAADATAAEPVEIETTDTQTTLSGYAVVWGAISAPKADGKRYRFNRGSIKWTPEVFALWNHSYSDPLAALSDGSLRLVEDEKGIAVEFEPIDTVRGVESIKLVQRFVRGMSFGGSALSLQARPSGIPGVWEVVSFAADEVSVTPIPAMPETSVEVLSQSPPEITSETMQEKSSQVEKEIKRRTAKQLLAHYKLATYRIGRVSGSR